MSLVGGHVLKAAGLRRLHEVLVSEEEQPSPVLQDTLHPS